MLWLINLLVAVKTRYQLTSIMCPYHKLIFEAHQGHMFFELKRQNVGMNLPPGTFSTFTVAYLFAQLPLGKSLIY